MQGWQPLSTDELTVGRANACAYARAFTADNSCQVTYVSATALQSRSHEFGPFSPHQRRFPLTRLLARYGTAVA